MPGGLETRPFRSPGRQYDFGAMPLPPEDRQAAIQRYRFFVEQALARADLLRSSNLTLLQAIILFITSVGSEGDIRYAWSMTSLAVRMAQGLGLHRDGGLTPFDRK
jgi:transcription factor-like protein